MKVAVLRDNHTESSLKWEMACKKYNLLFMSINILRNDWLELIREFDPSFCVTRPPGDILQNKRIFDEKIFFLQYFTDYLVYPGFLETFIYENKSALAWFLKTNNIPHPVTYVSSDREEAADILEQVSFPLVAKTVIGAAGSGVKILQSKKEAENYIRKTYSKGIRRRFGPNRKVGTPRSWINKAIQSPEYFFKKLQQYRERNDDIQEGILIFQEYIEHEFEWRCVRIGDSYFAYKKLKIGEKASGSKQFEYGPPPIELLDFTRRLCEEFKFLFMSVDIFYNDKRILVNELQTIFGHKNPYICKVNDQTGRYLFNNGTWEFQTGDFNRNESYNLRLEEIIKIYGG
ncbi:MAG: hypothetical protein JXB49_16460 [Bacteroidales bacterium]|nr:hypothetical protein [Bacteroidales bacterium]